MSAYLANQVGSMVPLAGMLGLKQLYQQFLDDKVYKAKGFVSVARGTPVAGMFGLKPKLNALREVIQPGGEIGGYRVPEIKRFWTGGINDRVWEFLNDRHIWLSDPKSAKILGKAMTEDQLYDFTAFRGQHLRQLIGQELPLLDQIEDPGQLDKEVKRLQSQARQLAAGDMLQGRKPVLK